MDLYLSNHHKVRNANYATASGQVLYKVETPGPIYKVHRTTTISKIIPNGSPDDMTDRFKEIATIEWHPIGTSITYGGTTTLASEFMPRTGMVPCYRTFTAPGDGRTFRWTAKNYKSRLELNDDSKTHVAQGHRSNAGIIGKPRQARLEIYTGFEHLADIIVITYIYVEKLRKDENH